MADCLAALYGAESTEERVACYRIAEAVNLVSSALKRTPAAAPGRITTNG